MEQVHLTVYFNAKRNAHDGRGYCVDIDHPDYHRQRSPGIGNGFATAKQAGDYVTEWLEAYAHGDGRPPEIDPLTFDVPQSAEIKVRPR